MLLTEQVLQSCLCLDRSSSRVLLTMVMAVFNLQVSDRPWKKTVQVPSTVSSTDQGCPVA